MSTLTKRVHILGVGNLGRFFAHSLHRSNKIDPISLLFHRPSLQEEWEEAGRVIELTSRDLNSSAGSTTVESAKYDIEPTYVDTPDTAVPIQNLIVTTKAYDVVKALSAIWHRLTPRTTILFTQNGLGTIPRVTRELFPDPATRPQYLAALTTHGFFSLGPFRSVHAGEGGMSFGHVSPPTPTTAYLVRRILDAPALKVAYFDRADLWKMQAEKLVINAILNPLCSLFRCSNGELLWVGIPRRPVKRLARQMLHEIHHVLVNLTDQISVLDADRFGLKNMEILVSGTAKLTRKNICSMLQDVLSGRETEIDAINGWLVAEGEKMGADMTMNKKVIELVKANTVLYDADIPKHFPGIISQEELELWAEEVDELRRRGVVTAKKRLYNEKGLCVQAW
ncbi:hypothetical protein K3495_g6613 [Podosphaera aphanis]|nr:hypothetical protein K3495_g6613 [Podosphaera aphanis]